MTTHRIDRQTLAQQIAGLPALPTSAAASNFCRFVSVPLP